MKVLWSHSDWGLNIWHLTFSVEKMIDMTQNIKIKKIFQNIDAPLNIYQTASLHFSNNFLLKQLLSSIMFQLLPTRRPSKYIFFDIGIFNRSILVKYWFGIILSRSSSYFLRLEYFKNIWQKKSRELYKEMKSNLSEANRLAFN